MNTKSKDQQLAEAVIAAIEKCGRELTLVERGAVFRTLSDAQVNDAFRALEYQQSFPVQK